MTVRSKPIDQSERRAPALGVIRARHVETAFLTLLYAAVSLLAGLSVCGTFYGLAGRSAPLTQPWGILGDIAANAQLFGAAFGVQLALTVVQWGARQWARAAARWWLAYLAALGISVYYNLVAYYDPLIAVGVPGWAVIVGLLLADAAPELIVVRRE